MKRKELVKRGIAVALGAVVALTPANAAFAGGEDILEERVGCWDAEDETVEYDYEPVEAVDETPPQYEEPAAYEAPEPSAAEETSEAPAPAAEEAASPEESSGKGTDVYDADTLPESIVTDVDGTVLFDPATGDLDAWRDVCERAQEAARKKAENAAQESSDGDSKSEQSIKAAADSAGAETVVNTAGAEPETEAGKDRKAETPEAVKADVESEEEAPAPAAAGTRTAASSAKKAEELVGSSLEDTAAPEAAPEEAAEAAEEEESKETKLSLAANDPSAIALDTDLTKTMTSERSETEVLTASSGRTEIVGDTEQTYEAGEDDEDDADDAAADDADDDLDAEPDELDDNAEPNDGSPASADGDTYGEEETAPSSRNKSEGTGTAWDAPATGDMSQTIPYAASAAASFLVGAAALLSGLRRKKEES